MIMPPTGVDARRHSNAGSAPPGVDEMSHALAAEMPSPVASGLLSGTAHYLHWGPIQISLTNFVIIVAMVALFALALVVPFPRARAEEHAEERSDVQH